MQKPVYLDNNATTAVDPIVLEEMLPYFNTLFGNPSSKTHSYGWKAEFAVDKAREQVAKVFNCSPEEIYFTSGATESNNIALQGIAYANKAKGKHIISSPVEHKATIDTLKYLEKQAFSVSFLDVNEYGQITPEKVAAAIQEDTILISIMAANNEIGSLNDVKAIGEIAQSKNILFHSDLAQAVGKIDLNMTDLNIDLASISGHKIYGPKGIGALYVRKKSPKIAIDPILFGGGQESGVRPGTLNVTGIVGLGKACELMQERKSVDMPRIQALSQKLHDAILTKFPDTILNGHPTERLYNNMNFSFPYISGESLMASLCDLAISSGSACNATASSSYVLKAIGRSDQLASASLRFGLGRFTTEEEIDFCIETVYNKVEKLRDLSPELQVLKKKRL